jgi:hypothetical protein
LKRGIRMSALSSINGTTDHLAPKSKVIELLSPQFYLRDDLLTKVDGDNRAMYPDRISETEDLI